MVIRKKVHINVKGSLFCTLVELGVGTELGVGSWESWEFGVGTQKLGNLMFDVSFTEVLVVITAAGVLLQRKDIVAGSRMCGTAFGRIVGTLQGMRTKFEQQSKGTEMYQLHSSVRHGLMDMRTIGYDLVNVSPFNQGPLPTFPSPPPTVTGAEAAGAAAIATATSTTRNPPLRVTTPSPPSALRALLQPPVASQGAYPDVARLARLILAEEELHIRTGKYNPDADGGSAAAREVDGADLIQSVVKESIIAEAFKAPRG